MAELSAVHLLDGSVQTAQRGKALRSNSNHDASPVLSVAITRQEPAFFYAIEQAGYIRVARDHTLGDLAAEQTLRRPSQDTQHVILRG